MAVVVRFRRGSAPYNAGEVAGFPEDEARRLIATGVAEEFRAAAPSAPEPSADAGRDEEESEKIEGDQIPPVADEGAKPGDGDHAVPSPASPAEPVQSTVPRDTAGPAALESDVAAIAPAESATSLQFDDTAAPAKQARSRKS